MAGKKKSGERIYILDGLRGLSMLAVIFYHFIYDLDNLFDVNVPFIEAPFIITCKVFFPALFMLVSGICTAFSRSCLRRGLLLLAAAYGITLVTFFALPEVTVYFGIIHFMGSSMIIYWLLKTSAERIAAALPAIRRLYWILPAVYTVLYIWTSRITGYSKYPHLYAFGFADAEFTSGDYFPLLPWIFFFLCGAWLAPFIKERRFPRFFYKIRLPVAETLGRHSLWVYILHQPVIYGALTLWFHLRR